MALSSCSSDYICITPMASASKVRYCAVLTVVHSAQSPCPRAVPNSGRTRMVPRLGNGLQFMVKAIGGTTAGIARENGVPIGAPDVELSS